MAERSLPDDQLKPGGIYRRSALHTNWGGQRYGGISTPANSTYAFLFTGETGGQFGYEDRWLTEDTYEYSGEGQQGDMELVRGNRSIVERSPDIHLFTILGDGLVRYVHQMFYADHHFRQGKDRDGRERQLVLFKLRKYTREHLGVALAAKQRALRA